MNDVKEIESPAMEGYSFWYGSFLNHLPDPDDTTAVSRYIEKAHFTLSDGPTFRLANPEYAAELFWKGLAPTPLVNFIAPQFHVAENTINSTYGFGNWLEIPLESTDASVQSEYFMPFIRQWALHQAHHSILRTFSPYPDILKHLIPFARYAKNPKKIDMESLKAHIPLFSIMVHNRPHYCIWKDEVIDAVRSGFVPSLDPTDIREISNADVLNVSYDTWHEGDPLPHRHMQFAIKKYGKFGVDWKKATMESNAPAEHLSQGEIDSMPDLSTHETDTLKTLDTVFPLKKTTYDIIFVPLDRYMRL